jgi:hypothetical protein
MEDPVPEAGDDGPLVAQAVERMAAAKIAVGLPPLAVLGLYGLVQALRHGLQPVDHMVMAIGAVLSMAAMVIYGMQAVSMVLEKRSPWDGLVFAGSFVPLLFAGYVIVTRVMDLWQLGGTDGLGPVAVNVILLVLAVMCLRAQWKLTEVHLLAREMAGVGGVGPDRGLP